MQKSLLSSKKDDWCTPQEVIDAILSFSDISLDPCSNPHSLVPAAQRVMLPENGLAVPWNVEGGITYVNPPYGRAYPEWVKKALLEHSLYKAQILMLIAARPDTKIWQDVIFPGAASICFWRGRIQFVGAPNPAPFPSALVYFGEATTAFSLIFGKHGAIVTPTK